MHEAGVTVLHAALLGTSLEVAGGSGPKLPRGCPRPREPRYHLPVTHEELLTAQGAALDDDARIRERARAVLELSLEERVEAMRALCARGAALRETQPLDEDRRIEAVRWALSDDARAALRRLYGHEP